MNAALRIIPRIFKAAFTVHLLIGLVPYFDESSILAWLIQLIDNPHRRQIQSPEKLSPSFEPEPGMRIEVGCKFLSQQGILLN